MSAERSAGAVIFRKENGVLYYLLLHYTRKYWDLPKGHLEGGETSEQAAIREIKEETGISVAEFVPGFKETIKYFYMRNNKKTFKTVEFFLAKTETKEVKISYEHQGFKWLPYEKALEQLTYKNAQKVLKKANYFLRNKENVSR